MIEINPRFLFGGRLSQNIRLINYYLTIKIFLIQYCYKYCGDPYGNLASGKTFKLASKREHIIIKNDRMCQLSCLSEGS